MNLLRGVGKEFYNKIKKVVVSFMEFGQRLNEKSEEILAKKGYGIDVSFYKGGDRREDSPDHVSFSISKDGQPMFKSEFRTQFEGDVYDEFGDSLIAECLMVRKNKDYENQRMQFVSAISELHNLPKLFSGKRRKMLEAKCAKLEIFKKAFIPFASDGIYADIPLLETNREELVQIYNEIMAIKKQAKKSGKSDPETNGIEKE